MVDRNGEDLPRLFKVASSDLNVYANVKRWYLVIAGRPAVQRGYKAGLNCMP